MARIPDVGSLGARPVPRAAGLPNITSVGGPVAEGANIIASEASRVGQTGATVAAGLENLTSELQQATNRVQNREDTIRRVNETSAFNEEAQKLYRSALDDPHLSDPDSAKKFGTSISELADKTITSHTGTAESRALLAERLNGIRSQLMNSYAVSAVTAQHAKIDNHLSSSLGPIVAQTYNPGSKLSDDFKQWDSRVDDMAGAMSPERADQWRREGKQSILTARITDLVSHRAFDDAEKLVNSEDAKSILSPEKQIEVRTRISTDRIQQDKELNKWNIEIGAMERAVGPGFHFTPDQKQKLVTGGRIGDTLQDKITNFETVMSRTTGQPYHASPIEVKRLAGAMTPEDTLNQLGSKDLMVMADLAPAFGAGMTTPDQDRKIESAVANYIKPQRNPETGLMVQPNLPPFMSRVLQQRGYTIDRDTGSLVGPQQQAQAPPPATTPAATAPQPTTQPTSQQGFAPPAAGVQHNIFNEAHLITGPIAKAGSAIAGTPLFGEVVRSPQMTQAQQNVRNLQDWATKAMEQNPRFPEGERKQIMKDLELLGQFDDTPENYRNRLIGMDDNLAQMQKNAFNTMNSAVGQQERIHARNSFNMLTQLRESLGVPPVLTPEQAKKLYEEGGHAGMQYRTNDGRVLTIKQKSGETQQ